MITGDKKETALSCASSSRIVGGAGIFVEMEGHEVVSALEKETGGGEHLEESTFIARNISKLFHRGGRNYIDSDGGGSTPSSLQTNASMDSQNLFDCDGVVIYRATPSQKGRITELMVRARKNVLPLGMATMMLLCLKMRMSALGSLMEGNQAALAVDFGIPQFRLLRNLIFVHGRYNLIRYSKVAVNAYYKNLVFIAIQYFYNFYNGASGRSIYNNFFMNYYNLFFTLRIFILHIANFVIKSY